MVLLISRDLIAISASFSQVRVVDQDNREKLLLLNDICTQRDIRARRDGGEIRSWNYRNICMVKAALFTLSYQISKKICQSAKSISLQRVGSGGGGLSYQITQQENLPVSKKYFLQRVGSGGGGLGFS